jgi:hypothetical protein
MVAEFDLVFNAGAEKKEVFGSLDLISGAELKNEPFPGFVDGVERKYEGEVALQEFIVELFDDERLQFDVVVQTDSPFFIKPILDVEAPGGNEVMLGAGDSGHVGVADQGGDAEVWNGLSFVVDVLAKPIYMEGKDADQREE